MLILYYNTYDLNNQLLKKYIDDRTCVFLNVYFDEPKARAVMQNESKKHVHYSICARNVNVCVFCKQDEVRDIIKYTKH